MNEVEQKYKNNYLSMGKGQNIFTLQQPATLKTNNSLPEPFQRPEPGKCTPL